MATPHATMTQISAPESQGFDPRRLARVKPKMQAYVDSGDFAGISTLLARRGKIIHFDHTGVRDKASQEPLDSSTIFRIYSMTKPSFARR
jgi:CubicO group peptidase (beta-lactamase class C family)